MKKEKKKKESTEFNKSAFSAISMLVRQQQQ